MKLYFSPGACSLAPNIVAHEAGLAARVQLVKVDLRAKTIAGGGDYLAINPKGYVPALELDDGTVLTEGPAIMQYLADLAPAASLAPVNGTVARYQLQAWLTFVGTEIHKAWSPLWHKDAHPAIHEASRAAIAKRFGNLKATLEQQPYLMSPPSTGDGFSVADAYLFVITNWGRATGVDLAQWPWIAAHHARVKARPSVAAAIAAEKAAA
jgi:glutathione S-transferase